VSDHVFIEQAPVQGAERALESGTTIGREGCDITLTDPDVSRRHAAIRIAAGEVTIEDLGSTNGTLVNGETITEPRTLRDGDEVRIGSAIWRLRAPAAATRLSDVPSEMSPASQATTLRPAATPAPEPPTPAASEPATEEARPAASAPAPAPSAPREAAPAPSASREAAPAPSERAPAPMSAAATPAPAGGVSRRGDVPAPDFAPSAIRRIVPTEATTAFTPETQGGQRGSAATRGGATLFTTIVIAASTVGVVLYYITEPFK
jgi:predicted component of type VI protein secretion system